MKVRAGLYLRISSDPGGLRAGVERQREDCLKLAAAKGWTVAETYIDNDSSAWNGRPRPEYGRMLEDLKAGTINGVIVWHLDRLVRRPAELETFFEITDAAGVKNLATASGDIDLSTHDGQFTGRILGAVAKKESDDKSRRIRRKHEQLAKDGRALGGVTTPFGYQYDPTTKKMTPHPTQARVARLVFDRYASGWGLKQLARDLNSRGIVGQRGRTVWKNSGITKILDNPTYAGFRHYRGELTKGEWKPLISPELFEEVEAIRKATKAPTPAQNRTGKGQALLSGLLFCENGHPMWRSTYRKHDERSDYVCSHATRRRWGDCRAGGISALRVERIVTDAFLENLEHPYGDHVARAPLAVSAERQPNHEQRLEEIDAKMERLVALAVDGPGMEKAFRKKAETLEQEREEVERQIAVMRAQGIDSRRRRESLELLREKLADLRLIWKKATTEERNQMLRLAVERVDVSGVGRMKEATIRWLRLESV